MLEVYLDLFPLFIYITIFIFSFILEKRLLIYIEKHLYERKSSTLILFSLLSGFLFLSGWLLENLIQDTSYKHLFKNFVIFTTTIFILRSIFRFLIKAKIIQYVVYLLLTFVFILSVIRINLSEIDESLSYYILYINKFFIILTAYIVFFNILKIIKDKNIYKFLKITLLSTLSVFLIVWEFELITLSFNTLIGFIILLAITGLYYYLINYSISFIKKYIEPILSKNDIKSLEFNLKIFYTSLYLLIIKELLGYFLNFDKLFKLLDSYYILKNELVSISIYSIVKVILASFILFSFLNILKKAIKLTFLKDKRYVEAGSAEALIFNLGILFNIMILMSILGITWKFILPVAGTLGIGIGFGLQTIMNNYISGFILMFSRKLKVGDIVELPSISVSTLGNTADSIFGKIEDIGILSTIIKTNDGVDISIPNSEFLSSPIINFSYRDPLVRLRIPVGVAYSSDPNLVKNILLEVAKEIHKKLNYDLDSLPPTQVWFREMADSSLIFITGMWINIRENIAITNVISDFYYTAWYKLKGNGIEIPFPQNDVWFRNKLNVVIETGKKPPKWD